MSKIRKKKDPMKQIDVDALGDISIPMPQQDADKFFAPVVIPNINDEKSIENPIKKQKVTKTEELLHQLKIALEEYKKTDQHIADAVNKLNSRKKSGR